jgi:hypothetical protein
MKRNHILVLTGDDARRFDEYEYDPYCTVRGLILVYEARLLVNPDDTIAKQRLEILRFRDPDEVIYSSQFDEIFHGDDRRQRYL